MRFLYKSWLGHHIYKSLLKVKVIILITTKTSTIMIEWVVESKSWIM